MNSSSQPAVSGSGRAVPFASEMLVAVATGTHLTMPAAAFPSSGPSSSSRSNVAKKPVLETTAVLLRFTLHGAPFDFSFVSFKVYGKRKQDSNPNEEENHFYGLLKDLSAFSQRKLHSSHKKSRSQVKTPKRATRKWVDPQKAQEETMKRGEN